MLRAGLPLIAAIVIGCSAAEDGASPSMSQPTVMSSPAVALPVASEPSTTLVPGRLPAEELLLEARLAATDEQYTAWQEGTAALVNRCLVAKGFEPVATRPGAADRRLLWDYQLDQLYFDDRDRVSVDGYRAFPPPWLAEDVSDSSEVNVELEGAADECAQPIRETFTRLATVLGDDSDLSSLAVEAQATIFSTLASTPEIVSAQRAWNACMEGAGYPESVRPSGSSGPVGGVDQALADFDCRVSSGVTLARIEVIRAGVDAWIEQNPTIVAAILDFNQQLADAGLEFARG